jgi:predicted nucleic acid-binding protein
VILLDTSVLSRIFRRQRPGPAERELHAAFETLVSSDRSVGLPGIVLQEVLSGLKSEKQLLELREKLLAAFAIVPATVDDHVQAARLKNACIARGLNVSSIDCLIAASAIGGGHRLFAVDADFEAIRRHSDLELVKAKDLT